MEVPEIFEEVSNKGKKMENKVVHTFFILYKMYGILKLIQSIVIFVIIVKIILKEFMKSTKMVTYTALHLGPSFHNHSVKRHFSKWPDTKRLAMGGTGAKN